MKIVAKSMKTIPQAVFISIKAIAENERISVIVA